MASLLPASTRPGPTAARALGGLVSALSGAAILLLVSQRLRRPSPASKRAAPACEPAARDLRHSAALLAASVLADSSIEHYRGAFLNPGMLAPSSVASAMLFTDAKAPDRAGAPQVRDGVHLTALAVGTAGTAFHLYNVRRRLGGLSWGNLFYGAPLGAPAALSLAGVVGLASDRIAASTGKGAPQLLGLPAGRVLAAVTGGGLAGTVGEASLLHFRGAFHNPVMWLPVTIPPMAALLLVKAAVAPGGARMAMTRVWLVATAILGVAGVGFHLYGVGRHMGGWRNWSQNLLDGPPIPAPPSFAALAIAGLAALSLIEQSRG